MADRGLTRLVSVVLMTVVVVVASLSLAPASQADTGPRFRISVDRHAVHGGQTLTARATATTTCTWVLEWNGERRVHEGRTLTASFVAPVVGRPTRLALHATCFHQATAPAGSSTGGNFAVVVPPSWRHDVVVVVLPPGAVVSPPQAPGGHGHAGGLAGTGGPALAVVLAGLVLVVAGTTLVRRASPDVVPG